MAFGDKGEIPRIECPATLAGVGSSFASPKRTAALGQIASADEARPASAISNLLVMIGFGLGPLLFKLARSRT